VRLDIEARGVEHASGLFSDKGKRIADVKPVWRELTRWLNLWERWRFGGSNGWAPLDEDTVRQKGGNARILHLTGVLERALTTWRAPGQRLRIGRESMQFGLAPNGAAYYGRFHQYGESVPERTVLEWPLGAPDKASSILLRHLQGRLSA
jgi:hypothetical protein